MKQISFKEGRVKQKLKTRMQILEAAKVLMSKKRNITLEGVAQEANVSRATIYRYFPNIELLYSEASLDIHYSSPNALFEEVKDMSLSGRILKVQSYYNQLAQDHELIFRRYLSAVLNESIVSKKKIRGARRVATMELVLDSFKKEMSGKNLQNLKNIASILMGIDSLIVAKDVCGLSNKEADDTLKWGIEMILKGLYSDMNQA
jgi:AcrR family transcriptional regulator